MRTAATFANVSVSTLNRRPIAIVKKPVNSIENVMTVTVRKRYIPLVLERIVALATLV